MNQPVATNVTYTRVWLTIFTLLLFLASPFSHASDRLALIIGIGQYDNVRKLSNPENDAADIAAELVESGFSLFDDKYHLNLTERQLLNVFNRFSEAAYGKEMVFLYFAGHGMQFNKEPHILPRDVPAGDMDTVQRESISLDYFIRKLDRKAGLTIAVFDACREIPEYEPEISNRALNNFSAVNRGLSRPQFNSRATVIAYSGASGQLVSDGIGRNSPYTKELLENLDREEQLKNNWDVTDTFQVTAYELAQITQDQTPEVITRGIQPDFHYFYDQQISQPRDTTDYSPDTPAIPVPDNIDSTQTKRGNWCSNNRALCILGGVVLVGSIAAASGGGGDSAPAQSETVTITIPVP